MSSSSSQVFFRCRIRIPEHMAAGFKGKRVVIPHPVGTMTAYVGQTEFRWLRDVGLLEELEAVVTVTTVQVSVPFQKPRTRRKK